MGGAVFPPCCLTWGQTLVEIMKITGDLLQKAPSSHCCTQSPWPCSGPPPTHTSAGDSSTLTGKSGSVSVGSLPLSPGSWCTQGSVCALRESISLVLCKFWQLYGGVNGTSSKRAYATPRSAAPRASAPVAGHCWPSPLQETLRHRSGSVSVGSLGPGAHKVWALQVSLGRMGFDSKCDFAPPTILLGILCPWTWGIFFGEIQHSPVNSCSAASCNFGVLTGEDERTSFYPAISLCHGTNPLEQLYCCATATEIWTIASTWKI